MAGKLFHLDVPVCLRWEYAEAWKGGSNAGEVDDVGEGVKEGIGCDRPMPRTSARLTQKPTMPKMPTAGKHVVDCLETRDSRFPAPCDLPLSCCKSEPVQAPWCLMCSRFRPSFRKALTIYHDAVQDLSFRFVNLIEEAFGIPVGTFDHFFGLSDGHHLAVKNTSRRSFFPPQHRIKLCRCPPASPSNHEGQGAGAHKDSSGWLTFLYQVGNEPGLEVLSSSRDWLPVKPIEGNFVVNFGNAFDAATEGAVKATIHRVIAPKPDSNVRYSIPFFQGLPLDITVTEVRRSIPESVRRMRTNPKRANDTTSSFPNSR